MAGSEGYPAESEGAAGSRIELSDLLLRACHDLRAPVRSIRAHSELVLKDGTGGDPGALRERLDFIVQGARQIELLTDGISTYSIAMRINRSEFRPAAMATVLRAALGRISRELNQRGAEVAYGDLPSFKGDADRLTEVFENLFLNAVRHSGVAEPRIQVSAEKRVGSWEISVEDNGRGVEASCLERIFKPFERLRPRETEGPGLGLAISREIVERHGGRIWAENRPGKGGIFRFTIPQDNSG